MDVMMDIQKKKHHPQHIRFRVSCHVSDIRMKYTYIRI